MRKGAKTREAILERAVSIASQNGLSGLTIGGLAKELELSKSGLIAHFGTKEALDLAVLQAGAALFSNNVLVPASRSEPGEARVRALFDGWLVYANLKQLPGGDLFFAATAELDDRPGVCRYYLTRVQKDWLQSIDNATREAMTEGHFRESLDPAQISFNIVSILYGYHVYSRLLNDPLAKRRTQAAFEALLARARAPGYTPPPANSDENSKTKPGHRFKHHRPVPGTMTPAYRHRTVVRNHSAPIQRPNQCHPPA